jgi:hypothetical protein
MAHNIFWFWNDFHFYCFRHSVPAGFCGWWRIEPVYGRLLVGSWLWNIITQWTIFPEAPDTKSVKLSDFTVWSYAWRKNWVNCAVSTGNSAGLRTVLSSRISHRELRSLLRESPQFSQFTCRHHDGIISRHSIELTNLMGKPVLCQRTFSSVFRAVFTQLNCAV